MTNRRLHFGTWERIFYGEFDGRRRKRVLVKSHRHAVPARCSFGIIGIRCTHSYLERKMS
ncbi:MAG: YjbQ family protein [Anaerolineae bacterium]